MNQFNENEKKILSYLIYLYRKNNHLTQISLADASYINQSTISKIEKNKLEIDQDTYLALFNLKYEKNLLKRLPTIINGREKKIKFKMEELLGKIPFNQPKKDFGKYIDHVYEAFITGNLDLLEECSQYKDNIKRCNWVEGFHMHALFAYMLLFFDKNDSKYMYLNIKGELDSHQYINFIQKGYQYLDDRVKVIYLYTLLYHLLESSKQTNLEFQFDIDKMIADIKVKKIIELYIFVGIYYFNQHKYKKSYAYLLQAFNYYKDKNNQYEQMHILKYINYIQMLEGQYDLVLKNVESFDLSNDSIKITNDFKLSLSIQKVYCLMYKKQYQDAMELLSDLMVINQNVSNYYIQYFYEVCEILLRLKDKPKILENDVGLHNIMLFLLLNRKDKTICFKKIHEILLDNKKLSSKRINLNRFNFQYNEERCYFSSFLDTLNEMNFYRQYKNLFTKYINQLGLN